MKTLSIAFCLLVSTVAYAQKLQLNDSAYFETPGVNILVFNSQYNGMFFDEKTAGIELIHHGVRTATGGAVRLQHTPEQWDLVPALTGRKVDRQKNSIETALRYDEFGFNSRITVMAKDNGVEISVFLDKPLPEKLEGKAGFNLEFLPTAYFEKSYLVDGKAGSFPLYPAGSTKIASADHRIPQFAGHTTFDDRERNEFIVPQPLAAGNTIVLAPEDPERLVKIHSTDAALMLFDGRNLAQNGWFIVRSLLPANKTGKVLSWYLEANAIPNWKRAPMIAFSQVGYRPLQEKTAVIELDKNDLPLPSASLFQVTSDGTAVEKLKAETKPWGQYLRYNYVKFDFTAVKEPGLYFIQYGDQKTNVFTIGQDIYKDSWHPTLDVWFPVQMDHMQVNEAYRIWHGVPFLDDALQAPVNHQHFDGYKMGPVTDTKYKPYERIPGLAVGGWFDAGDFDIQTGSHCSAILSFVAAWEKLQLNRDETFIDQATRYVDIHRPDGKPDLLQQIEHGTLNLVAQVKNIGHPVRGIIVPYLHQYHHLGDASTETDNLPYNSSLKPWQSDGRSSGTKDDRWAFTNRSPFLDYHTAAALAAAHRALKGYNDSLSQRCLQYARKLWSENARQTTGSDTGFMAAFRRNSELAAALQLFVATKDEQYASRFKSMIFPALDRSLQFGMAVALQAYPFMDKDYQNKMREYVVKFKTMSDGYNKLNPFGVPMTARGWGGNATIINWAITNYYAHTLFPDIIGAEYIYKGLNYIYGCHPYHNLSFVSAVGTRSKKVTYGINRADFSYIAGGVVPGLLLLQPDFPENKEDWPFLWGENEVVIDICASYIFLSAAVNDLKSK
ncbi:glycoside hydrolase family 9 protein [Niastella populi]|uniref:Glycoside hydrolase n=1 Tax=Niastella populi TaxID=550983 RepID=A0A1V9FEX0_9BACT|nr:glycoside hydrolase family 9 protein [Niastella populi]OQP56766.1 glycoside hydrolase [Niastella populi]